MVDLEAILSISFEQDHLEYLEVFKLILFVRKKWPLSRRHATSINLSIESINILKKFKKINILCLSIKIDPLRREILNFF